MTVYPLFRDTRFDPEHIAIMSRVFEEVTVDCGLVPKEDGICNLVAEAIIHCAERGVRDPEEMRRCAREVIKSN